MINIDIDMHPFGSKANQYALGRITITNDGASPDPKCGNYIVRAFSKDGRQIREARVDNWARLSRPVFELIKAGLEAMGYK